MPRPPDPHALDAVRAHWTGLDAADLRAASCAPLPARRFLRAFPLAVDEAEAALRSSSWPRDPRDAVRQAYELRALERFSAFLGLAEVERRTSARATSGCRADRAPRRATGSSSGGKSSSPTSENGTSSGSSDADHGSSPARGT